MENARNCTRKKRYYRLLSFLLFCLFSLFAFNANAQEVSLRFVQESEFTVSENSVFSIDIADVSPSNIEIINRSFPQGVTFVSSTKRDGFIRGNDGSTQKSTLITYTLRFSQEGMYDLGFLPIEMNSALQSIEFPVVNVFANPDVLVPELLFEQVSSFYKLKEGSFLLSARYVRNIERIDVSLSEHALIEQSEAFISLPSTDIDFTGNQIPIAMFSCTPFSEGLFYLPKITLTCIAYNGQTYTINLGETSVTVFPYEEYVSPMIGNDRESPLVENVGARQAAFMPERNENLVHSLLTLRIAEKYSFFPFEATQERKDLEKKENIQNGDETSYTLTIFLLALAILIMFCSFILFLMSKRNVENPRTSYVYFLLICAFAIVCVAFFYGRPLLREEALAYGGQLYTIPEYESKAITALYPGQKLQIQKSAGDWYLVFLPGGRSGWILKTDCVLIER